MKFKSGCFLILSIISVICEVESRPQFFFDTINKIKDKGAEIGCKIHKLGSKPFPHTHNVGTDPCSAQPDQNIGPTNSLDQFSNNGQNFPNGQTGFGNNGQAGYGNNGQTGYGNNGQTGYGNNGQNIPNGQTSYGNNGQTGYGSNGQNYPNGQTTGGVQNGQNSGHGASYNNQGNNGYNSHTAHQAEGSQNTEHKNNVQPNESQTNTHSSNAIVFPGEVEKPKPTIHNSQQGPGGRTILNKPNESSSGQESGASENVRPVQNSVTVASSTTSTTSTTTVPIYHKKPSQSHSSKRKNLNNDYSDEDEDSEERSKKKKKILNATPSPESSEETVAGVTDGRSLIGSVKTNCPEGYKADRKGHCREAY